MTNQELLAGLLPEPIAIRQAAWERRVQVLRARLAGATLACMADKMGVSKTRVNQMSWKAAREAARGTLSPATRYQKLAPALRPFAANLTNRQQNTEEF